MATTMKDVARQAGVDVSTVSLAINNDPRIRPETRDRILFVAREMGYRKNHLARGLRSGKSFTIGAVVGHATAFWSEVLAGAQSVLAEQDYHLLLDYAPDDRRREETQIDALKAKRVDGLLIAPPDRCEAEVNGYEDRDAFLPYLELRAEGVPFVFVDRWAAGFDADAVAADNLAAGRDAAKYLLDLGHRKIAYLYAPHRMNTAQIERREGYASALRAAGLMPLPWPASTSRSDRSEEALEATRALLASEAGKDLTAIVAATDSTAMGALRALHDAGCRVPEDVSVMGIGGTFTAAYLQPPLTTLTLPMREFGNIAARTLLARLEGDVSPFEHCLLPAELVARGSCAPAPKR